jgi:hypothetical protein
MKRCSALCIIRELKMKTAMEYHFVPSTMTYVQNTQNCQMLVKMWRKRNPHSQLMGMKTSPTTLEDIWGFVIKLNHSYQIIQKTYPMVFIQVT